jgi:hypothetical protein
MIGTSRKMGHMVNKMPFFAALFFAILLPAYGTSAADLKKAEFNVPGIQCATSGMKAAYAALSVEGVTEAVDDMTNNSLMVTFDDQKTDIKAVMKALGEAGLPAEGEPQYLQ